MKDLTGNNGNVGPSFYLRFLRFLDKILKKKNLIKITIITVILLIAFNPGKIGKFTGKWYKELVESFNENSAIDDGEKTLK